MRVVFIITGLDVGGAQAMLLKVVSRLDSMFEPYVVSLRPMGELGRRLETAGIPVMTLDMRAGWPNVQAFIRLIRFLRRFRPDAVHTWMYHADLFGGLAARLAGVRALGWCVRHSDLDPSSTKFLTRVVARVSALVSPWLPDQILVCSEKAIQIHRRIGYAADKMVLIPNGFDLRSFQPDPAARTAIREELGLDADAQLVGLVARYDRQKNHVGFLAAAQWVHRRMPSVRFVLAGTCVDHGNDELMGLVERHGLGGVTHLLGERGDMPRLMAALDVLALASTSGEGFPNVLGEAMACGVPCAATDVGDCAYVVGDTGRVVPNGDMVALAQAVEALLVLPADARLSLGGEARSRVAQHFEIGQVVKRYEAFYDALASIADRKQGVG